MIVYVESNFILEVALEQEQFSSAEAILKLVEENKIKKDYLISSRKIVLFTPP